MMAGEMPIFTFGPLYDSNNNLIDITGSQVEFVLNLGASGVFNTLLNEFVVTPMSVTKTVGNGITLGASGANGINTFQVAMQEADTKNLLGRGTYFMEARVILPTGQTVSTTTGRLTIEQSLIYTSELPY